MQAPTKEANRRLIRAWTDARFAGLLQYWVKSRQNCFGLGIAAADSCAESEQGCLLRSFVDAQDSQRPEECDGGEGLGS